MAWYDFDFDLGGGNNTSSSSQDSGLDVGGFNLDQYLPQDSNSSSSGWDLGSLFGAAKSGLNAFNKAGGGNLVQAGLGIYDAYNKKKNAQSLMPQINALNNMYAPGSPEAEQMRKRIEARDAASGRRSQYGTREVELAGELNKQRSNIYTSPGYLNLNAAKAGQSGGAYKGLADLFGQLSKTNFADGGLVGGTDNGASGDESDIQWKGTETGLGAKDLTFLTQTPTATSSGRMAGDDGINFSKSWKFDGGRKPMKDQRTVADDWVGEPTDEQISQMNPYATDAAGIASAVTGQGDAQLADFWSQGADLTNTQSLGDQGTQNVNNQWQQGYEPLYNDLINAIEKGTFWIFPSNTL